MRCPRAPIEEQKRKRKRKRCELTLGDLLQPQDVLRSDHGAGQQVLLRGHRDTHACRAATFPDPHRRRRLRLAAVCSSAVSCWLMSGSSLSVWRLVAAASAGTGIAHSPPPPLPGCENLLSPSPSAKGCTVSVGYPPLNSNPLRL